MVDIGQGPIGRVPRPPPALHQRSAGYGGAYL